MNILHKLRKIIKFIWFFTINLNDISVKGHSHRIHFPENIGFQGSLNPGLWMFPMKYPKYLYPA